MKPNKVNLNDKIHQLLKPGTDSSDAKVNRERAIEKLPPTSLKRPKVNQTNATHILPGSETRKIVRELRSANLCMNMSEIANTVGI